MFKTFFPSSCNKIVNFVKCNKSVMIRLVATCRRLVTFAICNKPVENLQVATDLSSTSCRKPCERILISACCNKLLQDVNRLVTTCAFLAVYVCECNITFDRP